MLLRLHPALKLVGASLMAAALSATTHVSAVPLLSINAKVSTSNDAAPPSSPLESVHTLDCVKILTPDTVFGSSLILGDKIPIRLDTSGCDQQMAGQTEPWTLSLVEKTDGEDTVKLVDVVTPGAIEYSWVVRYPRRGRQRFLTSDRDPIADSQYVIQVQAMTKDGQDKLVGQTQPFTIISPPPPSPPLNKRDDASPPAAAAPAVEDLSTLDSETPTVTPIEGVVDPMVNTLAPPPPPPPLLPASNTAAVDPASNPPATGQSAPAAAGPPETTFPNVAPVEADPALIPKVHGPNTPTTGSEPRPEEVPTPQPAPSKSDIFFKYAGLGAAALSTVGVGLGGLVGGILGGTAGLVIGLSLAAVNAAFYA